MLLARSDAGGQVFSAGLVDEVAMDVAPLVWAKGCAPSAATPARLHNDPDRVVQGDRVLHLPYTAKR